MHEPAKMTQTIWLLAIRDLQRTIFVLLTRLFVADFVQQSKTKSAHILTHFPWKTYTIHIDDDNVRHKIELSCKL